MVQQVEFKRPLQKRNFRQIKQSLSQMEDQKPARMPKDVLLQTKYNKIIEKEIALYQKG